MYAAPETSHAIKFLTPAAEFYSPLALLSHQYEFKDFALCFLTVDSHSLMAYSGLKYFKIYFNNNNNNYYNQAISSNYFKNKILKEEIKSKCRLCKQHEETIDHLTSVCPILAKNKCLMRHDKVCTHLHYLMCKTLGIETTGKWYTHMPKPVCEEGDVTVLWNQAVHTHARTHARTHTHTHTHTKKLQQIGQI